MCRYPPSTIHRYLDLPSTQRIPAQNSHRHNTTPLLQTLVQAPYPLPTYATHTTVTKTQTHVEHSPVPTGLVTPKPNPLTPSPPRAKHIHISHTLPTPDIQRSTLIHNTSAALDIMPKPRVPPTCPALITPHPSLTPAMPSTSHHHTISADTHATQTTVHASQSQQPPHPHRVPRQPHRQTKDNHMTTDTTQGHRPPVKVREISS